MRKQKQTAKTLLIFTIIGSLLASNIAMADCPNAVFLKVGDKVTDCNRIGLSEEYDLGVRKDLIEGDYNKKVIEEQKRLIDIKDLTIVDTTKKADLWHSEAERERKAYDEERSKGSTNLWVGIAIGVGLTVLSAWAVGQAARR